MVKQQQRHGQTIQARKVRRSRPRRTSAAQHSRTGRPPTGRTALGRWLLEQRLTARELADQLAALARKERIPPRHLPQAKTLGDAISGRHCPGPVVLLLIRTLTAGRVDLHHWVAEILSRT